MIIKNSELIKIINDRGDLHDCKIDKVEIANDFKGVDIFIADLDANFIGLPEYKGPKPASILCRYVSSLEFELAVVADSIRIYEMTLDYENGEHLMEIKMAPAGRMKLSFRSVEILCRL